MLYMKDNKATYKVCDQHDVILSIDDAQLVWHISVNGRNGIAIHLMQLIKAYPVS